MVGSGDMHNLMPLQYGIVSYIDELAQAFLVTLELYFVGLVLGFIMGLTFAIMRQFGGRVLSRIATGYIEVIRGTPLITQVLLVYAIPVAINAAGIADLPLNWYFYYIDSQNRIAVTLNWPILASMLGLGINSAAYQAEYMRGGFASITSGQLRAASSIGMTRWQSIRYIILPQGLRRSIPAWSNEAAYLPKYTVVAIWVGVMEILNMSKTVIARTFLSVEMYLILAIIFFVFITAINKVLEITHSRTKIPGV
ncbi:MAG: amino acid ABC transporter permease [Candidatus Thorarchaeota archaeon]|nr:MAG: amino acid ABC transporter permease [Candidatus Thorarchaeota archaeon]